MNRDLATVHLVHELKNLGFLGQEVDPNVRDSYQCLKLENKLIKSMAENRDTDVHLKPFLVKSLDKFMMDLSDEERYSIWDGFMSKWLVKF